MAHDPWLITRGEGPIVAAAIHDGHEVRPELADLLAIGDAERRREEDPYTGSWASVAPTRIVVATSRFEVDLNRPREKAVYRHPGDAWGLSVWKDTPSTEVVEWSLARYDEFYRQVRDLLASLVARHGRVVVLDLHSYNHRRGGPNATPADPAANPEVNLGTGTMDRGRWAPLVDRFLAAFRDQEVMGRRPDVRENVKFQGGQFSRWIHETFPTAVCALAIEFKKIFMDEWSGTVDNRYVAAIEAALRATVPAREEGLRQL